MPTPDSESTDGVLGLESVRIQLAAILGSRTFANAPRLSRFLEFVVEQTLRSNTDQLKEYSIAIEVFHRDGSFDPRIETIVRVQARRLREKLRKYYETEGQADSVAIELPKGHYVPTFRLAHALGSGSQPGSPHDRSRVAPYPQPLPASRHTSLWLAIAALAVVAAALAGWWSSPEPAFDSTAYRLRRLTYDNGLAFQPAISADGKLVVYASDRAGKGNLDIWLQQTAGGEPIQLTSDTADEFEPSFSPDGTQVAFRSGQDGGGIYVVPTLGGTPHLLAPRGYRPRFSPDGKRVAYWSGKEHVPGAGDSFVFWVAAEGGDATKVGIGRSPVWSPDGDKLLYLRARSGSPLVAEWVVATLDGKEPALTGAVEVLRQSELAGDPEILGTGGFVPELWLSDGRVLFSAGAGQALNIWSIYVSPRSGRVSGSPQRITTGSGEHRFASAANDGRLAFADMKENRDIWILPTDTNRGEATGKIRRATSNAAMNDNPSLSADGTKLAFRSNRSGAINVWMKNLTTDETKPLTTMEKDEGNSMDDSIDDVIATADGEFVAYTDQRPA